MFRLVGGFVVRTKGSRVMSKRCAWLMIRGGDLGFPGVEASIVCSGVSQKSSVAELSHW